MNPPFLLSPPPLLPGKPSPYDCHPDFVPSIFPHLYDSDGGGEGTLPPPRKKPKRRIRQRQRSPKTVNSLLQLCCAADVAESNAGTSAETAPTSAGTSICSDEADEYLRSPIAGQRSEEESAGRAQSADGLKIDACGAGPVGSKEDCGCNGGHKAVEARMDALGRENSLLANRCLLMTSYLEKLVQRVGVLEGENRQLKQLFLPILKQATCETEPVESETGTGHKTSDDVTGHVTGSDAAVTSDEATGCMTTDSATCHVTSDDVTSRATLEGDDIEMSRTRENETQTQFSESRISEFCGMCKNATAICLPVVSSS